VGEPPVSLSHARNGGPGDHRPWRGRGLRPAHEPVRDTTNARKQTRSWGASDKRRAPRGAGWQSERTIVPGQGGKSEAHATHGREGDAGHHGERNGTTGETVRSPTVTPTLQRLAAQAVRDPQRVCTTLAPRLEADVLREAYRHTSKTSAAGLDGVTATQYAEHLDEPRHDWHERRRSGR
jgi:hypothetical protein